MSFSGGVYTLPGPALVTGEVVSATENNQFRNDVAGAFNVTMLRNGTSTATANLPMGGYKLTGLGAPTTNGDALSYGAAAVVTTLTSTSLTATRVPYAGTGGLLQDASTFTFDGTTLTAGGFTTSGAISAGTITASGAITVSGGTANGVAYLNGSKVLTTGSALTFDGTSTFTVNNGTSASKITSRSDISAMTVASSTYPIWYNTESNQPHVFYVNNTEQMRLTSTGLGIGTSSPNANSKLTLADGTAAAQYFISTGSGGDTAYIALQKSADGLAFGCENRGFVWKTGSATVLGGTERMRIDSGGNLIVGGTTALNTFTGRGNITLNGASSAIISLGVGGVEKGYFYTQGADVICTADTGIFMVQTASSQPLLFNTNGSERMRIDSSGNVGIGTSSPSSQSSAASQLVVGNNTATVGMTIAAGSSNQGSLFFSKGTGSSAQQAAGYIYYLNSSDYMAFGTANTERMRIDSSGNLLVGTTSRFTLDLITNGGSYAQYGNQINFNSGNPTIEFVNRNSEGSKTYSWYYGASGSGTPATLSTSGVWTNSSDARGKENITDIEYGLQSTLQMKPRQFDVKSDGSHAVGFVAQEIKEVIPEVVHITCTKDGDDYYGIDYGSITAVLVKAIQELKAELDATKAEVAALKGN